MGFKFLTCCDRDFLAGGILCVALNLILRCKFSQNLPANDLLKKDPVKLQGPENCILPGFFKIVPPRRHSLGQRDRKGCGIQVSVRRYTTITTTTTTTTTTTLIFILTLLTTSTCTTTTTYYYLLLPTTTYYYLLLPTTTYYYYSYFYSYSSYY